MSGRFTARRTLPSQSATVADQDVTSAADGISWTVFPEPEPAAPPVAAAAPVNPLHSDKLLDAKVRLHRRLLEEVNLQALEKLPEDQMREHIQQLVGQYVVSERLALNTQELNAFVAEILTR